MWPLTGHCAINYDCERWKIGCGHCPYPDAHPPVLRDATRIEWKLKERVYSRSNLDIVTLSSKQTKDVKESMLSRFEVHHIPNGIDTGIYRPLDPELCRHVLGIPKRKRVLMAAALNLNQFNKGGDLLIKALDHLPQTLKSETILLLLGSGGENIASSTNIQTIGLGYVGGDHLKTICYSAADLFVHPTRAESLPLVLQESMACGTPMISFKVGGVPDIVRQGKTGYLAEQEDHRDFSKSIQELIENHNLRTYMSDYGVRVVQEEYTSDLQVERHLALYRKLLKS